MTVGGERRREFDSRWDEEGVDRYVERVICRIYNRNLGVGVEIKYSYQLRLVNIILLAT